MNFNLFSTRDVAQRLADDRLRDIGHRSYAAALLAILLISIPFLRLDVVDVCLVCAILMGWWIINRSGDNRFFASRVVPLSLTVGASTFLPALILVALLSSTPGQSRWISVISWTSNFVFAIRVGRWIYILSRGGPNRELSTSAG